VGLGGERQHQLNHIPTLPHRYPYNLDFDYGPLEGLQKFCINNLGDPFIESNYGVHSREFEVRPVLLGGRAVRWCGRVGCLTGAAALPYLPSVPGGASGRACLVRSLDLRTCTAGLKQGCYQRPPA
jgi:hypothetical protein